MNLIYKASLDANIETGTELYLAAALAQRYKGRQRPGKS
jgi:hypothetical protein